MDIDEIINKTKISDRHFKWLIVGLCLLSLDLGMLFVWSVL